MTDFTGEYFDPFNRGQMSCSWIIKREAFRCVGILRGRHGYWIATEQNAHEECQESNLEAGM